MTNVMFPDVTVELVGQDGNAFAIMGTVTKAMRRAGVPASVVTEYMNEAMSGDYNHLLRVTMETVTVS